MKECKNAPRELKQRLHDNFIFWTFGQTYHAKQILIKNEPLLAIHTVILPD